MQQLKELKQQVAKDNGISYEEVEKIVSHQFANARRKLADPSIDSVYIAKIGTFFIHKAKLQRRLDALLKFKHKRKYVHDAIRHLEEKGVVPSSEDFKWSL